MLVIFFILKKPLKRFSDFFTLFFLGLMLKEVLISLLGDGMPIL